MENNEGKMISKVCEIVFILIFITVAVIDLLQKKIYWIFPLGIGIGGILVSILIEGRSIMDIFWAVLPGLAALLIARLTKEQLGYGDAVMLIALGCLISVGRVLSIIMMGLFFAGIAALVMMIVLKKKAQYEIPFMPFLAAGYVLTMYGGL